MRARFFSATPWLRALHYKPSKRPALPALTPHRSVITLSLGASLSPSFESLKLPVVPPMIDLHHLHFHPHQNQLMLVSSEKALEIKNALHGLPDGKYSKKRELAALGISSEFSILKVGEKLFALYHGEKHKKLCGKGSVGTVKFAQDLNSGKWVIVKIQSESQNPTGVNSETKIEAIRAVTEQEKKILKKMGALHGVIERQSPTKGFQTMLIACYVDGRTLRTYHQFLSHFHRQLSLQFAIFLAAKICEALDRLHAQFQVHILIYPM